MREREWVESQVDRIAERLKQHDESLAISDQQKLPYAHEVRRYGENGPDRRNTRRYSTDLLVREELQDGEWKPRVVIEAKVGSITTHGAITYSEKAHTHKQVHPYLRYGLLLGHRQHYPLPGRLFRHGAHFDFMLSWVDYKPTDAEFDALIDLIVDEVRASRTLEEIIFNARSPNREEYTVLHRPLSVGQPDNLEGQE